MQSTTEVGGAESVLFNLFENSAALRERSVVASLSFGDGNLPERLREIGTEVVELPRARLRRTDRRGPDRRSPCAGSPRRAGSGSSSATAPTPRSWAASRRA